MIRFHALLLIVLLAGCGQPTHAPSAALADGVYEVLAVETDRAKLAGEAPGTRVLPFDHAYLRDAAERPVEFVRLRIEGAAPLDMAEAPTEGTLGDRPVLLLTLTPSAGEALEHLTTTARRAAVVVDGAIVTVHRIRIPIEGGRLQVSC